MDMGLCVSMCTGFLTPVEVRGVSCPGAAGAEVTGSCESHCISSENPSGLLQQPDTVLTSESSLLFTFYNIIFY